MKPRTTGGRAARVAVVLAIALGALVGCGGDDDASARPEPSTTTNSTGAPSSTTPLEATVDAPPNQMPGTATTTTAEPSSDEAAAIAERWQRALDTLAAEAPVPFSIVAVDLTTGARASVASDRQVLSASLYKLFVAAELLRQVAEGELDIASPAGDSQDRTVEQCLQAMIVVSDNDCGSAGLDLVGRGSLDDSLAEQRYASTSLATPQQTSADDVALFLARVHDGSLLGPGPAARAGTTRLYDLLLTQAVVDRFPQGLPPGTPIAHKTGDRRGWAHDAGIITTVAGPVLLVVLSGPWPEPCCDADRPGPAEAEAFAAIARVATVVVAARAG